MLGEYTLLYSKIPLSVVRNESLSATSKLLMAEIMFFSKLKGYAHASNPTYAKRIGASSRTIMRSLEELEMNGYISRVFPYEEEGNKTIRRIFVNEEKLISDNEQLAAELEAAGGNEIKPLFNDLSNQSNNDSDKMSVVSDKNGIPLGQNDTTIVTKMVYPSDKNGIHKNHLKNHFNNHIDDTKKDVLQTENQHTIEDVEETSNELKDNRPNGLSAPEVADEYKSESESIHSKLNKRQYQYDYKKCEYVLTQDGEYFKRIAEPYPYKENLDDAFEYFTDVVRKQILMSNVKDVINSTPADTEVPYIDFLKELVAASSVPK